MALAPFFSRAYSAIGAQLGITRQDLEQVLSGVVVGIHLGETCRTEGNDRWIAEMLANILARLYPILSISGDKVACDNISGLSRLINPHIEITKSPIEATVLVCIGGKVNHDNAVMTGASGWVAQVGRSYDHPLSGPINPYSSGAAAALAAWHVFQMVICNKDRSQLPDTSLSLLDFGADAGKSDELSSVKVGEVAIAGLGAVGNPAIWAWARHKKLTGTFHLIDPEGVELSNLQRYCLAHYQDVGIGKVKLAKRELQRSRLSMKLWPCTIEDFASNYRKIDKLPTICVSVDNIGGRRTAQALLPRLVVNGWTSDSGLGASWHQFIGESACLGCLYHPKGASLSQTELASNALGIPHNQLVDLWVSDIPLSMEHIETIEKHLGLSAGQLASWAHKRIQDVYTGVICGQVGVDLPSISRVATVPLAHQSILAGIIMAAELIKRSDPALESYSQAAPLIIWDDILRPPPKVWAMRRAKERECFCCDDVYRTVYSQKWKI